MNASARSEVKGDTFHPKADPIPSGFHVAFFERPQRREKLGALSRTERDRQREFLVRCELDSARDTTAAVCNMPGP